MLANLLCIGRTFIYFSLISEVYIKSENISLHSCGNWSKYFGTFSLPPPNLNHSVFTNFTPKGIINYKHKNVTWCTLG